MAESSGHDHATASNLLPSIREFPEEELLVSPTWPQWVIARDIATLAEAVAAERVQDAQLADDAAYDNATRDQTR